MCLSNKISSEHLSIENYLNLVNKQATVDLNSLSFDVQILSKPKKKIVQDLLEQALWFHVCSVQTKLPEH